MTSPLASEAAPFGRVLTAMVTPFSADGGLDLDLPECDDIRTANDTDIFAPRRSGEA